MAPFYEGTAESLRTLVTVSGGALVASISVVQFLGEKISDPAAGQLLAISWVLFVVTIISAMTAQAALTGTRLFRHDAIGAVNRIMAANPVAVDQAAIQQEIISHAARRHDAEMKRYNVSANVARLSFMAAFATMIGFALLNLPF